VVAAEVPSTHARIYRRDLASGAVLEVTSGINLPDSDTFQTFALLPVDTGPVRGITMGLRAEDLQASGEAVLTNVIIRAKEIQSK